MNKEKVAEWMSFIDENDLGLDSFISTKDKYKWLEEHRDEIRNIPGAPVIETPDLEKSVKTLSEEYSDWDSIPFPWKNKIAYKNNVSVEELQKSFDTQKSKERATSFVEQEANAAAATEEAKATRAKELENMPFYLKMLMSKESKDRYINTPEKSAFYYEKRKQEIEDERDSIVEGLKQQPGFLVLSKDKQDKMISDVETKYQKQLDELEEQSDILSDRVDVGLGTAGTVADMAPGMAGVLIGPAIRGARTVKNQITGDDKRTIQEAVRGVGADVAANIGVNYGPTAILSTISKRSKNAAKDAAGSLANAIWEGGVIGTAKKMQKDLDELGKMVKDSWKKKEKIVEKQPETLKLLREQGIRTQKEANIDRKFVKDIENNVFSSDIKAMAEKEGISELEAAEKYYNLMKESEYEKPFYLFGDGNKTYILENQNLPNILKSNIGETAAKYAEENAEANAAGLGGKLIYGLNKGFEVAGNPAVKTVGNASRDFEVPEAKVDTKKIKDEKEQKLKRLGLSKDSKYDDYNKELDRIIANTERQWEEGKFVPRAVPGDPMYEAYLKWQKRGNK